MVTVGGVAPKGSADRGARGSAGGTRWWYIGEAVALVILGIAAIALPTVATLALELMLGWVLLVAGVIGAVVTVSDAHAPGFRWSLLSAIVAITAGIVLLRWPYGGVLSLTVILVMYFLLEGMASIMYALDHRRERSASWQWLLASGALDLLLAVLILSGLPGASVWAIGLLIGVKLIFGGVALLAVAIRERGPAPRVASSGT